MAASSTGFLSPTYKPMAATFTTAAQNAINANTAGRLQAAASLANLDAFYLLVCGIFIFFMQVSGFALSCV